MEISESRPFNKRAFTAIMAAITGIGLPITGVANHIHQFESMTAARHAWMSAHNVLSILFVAFVVLHIVMNRRAMLNHAKVFASEHKNTRREALLSIGIVAIALMVAVGHAFIASH